MTCFYIFDHGAPGAGAARCAYNVLSSGQTNPERQSRIQATGTPTMKTKRSGEDDREAEKQRYKKSKEKEGARMRERER